MKRKLFVFIIAVLCCAIFSCYASDEWTCPSCSTINTGNFCSECGTAKPMTDSSWLCPKCQKENTGNFCGNCGTARPDKGDSSIVIKVKFNEKEWEGEYIGELKDGKPNGNGKFSGTNKDNSLTYEGEWKNGAISGKGYVETDSFLIHFSTTQGKYDRKGPFRGETLNGIPSGEGYFSTYNDTGNRWDYTGEWKNGMFNGQGLQQWYDEKDNAYQSNRGKFIDGEYTPLSLIVPSESWMSGIYVSTKRAKLQFEVKNMNNTKTIKSYVLSYYSVDENRNQVSETKTVTLETTLSPKQQGKTEYFFVDYLNAKGVAVAITKVTFTDGSYEVAEPNYLFWDDMF